MRVGIIGTGKFAATRAESVIRLGAEVTAVTSRNTERRQIFASKYGATAYANAMEFISPNKIDVLFIVVPPNSLDGRLEMRAIEQDIPLLCEKPVCLDLKVAKRNAEAISQRGLVSTSGYLLRHGASAQRIRDLLTRNTISMVRSCRMEPPPETIWLRNQQESGGPMVEAGTHSVDFMRWILGEVKSVYAATARGILPQLHDDATSYDSMVAQLVFASGAVASMDVTSICPDTSCFKMDFLDVYGKTFRLSLTDIFDGTPVRFHEGEEWEEFQNTPIHECLDLHTGNFLKAAEQRNPGTVLGSYPDAVKTLAVTLAMNQSAQTGAPVMLENM